MKKVYYSTGLSVGTAIVIANDEDEARTLLIAELKIEPEQLPDTVKLTRVSRAEVGVILIPKGY